MNLRDAPIRRKVTLVIMMTSTVVLLLTTGAFMVYEWVTFHENLLQNSQTIAQITAAQSAAAVVFENKKDSQEILSKLRAEPRILLAALYDKGGAMLAGYPSSAPSNSFPAQAETREYRIGNGRLTSFTPVWQDNQIVGSLYTEWDVTPAYRRLQWYGEMALAVLLGCLGIALVISNWLQRRISTPILELAHAARQVSETGDYSTQAKKYGNDELGIFTDSFNHMLAQIHFQNGKLRKSEEELRRALQSAEMAAMAVRALNAELEDRVKRRTAELAATNKELEAFGYSVSHDLRAPLRHIDAYAQILKDEIKKDPEEAVHYLNRIRLSSQNLGRMVDDLLKLSRIGRVEPNFETVKLNDILEEVLPELKMEAANRKIEWRIGDLSSAEVDPGLIKQVFSNLISNAIKYTRPRVPAIIEIGVEKVGDEEAIFVRDNGVGFNMKYAHKLFGVFQRLHRPDEFEGTGVGLATVQRIVRLHGGKIWVEAELDKGATFHFTLRSMESAPVT